MKSLFKQAVWLALLLPQLVYLLSLGFGQMQLLRRQWQFPSQEFFGHNPEMLFDPGEFGVDVLGIVTVLGLCATKRWARVVYTVGAAFVFVSFVFDLNSGPSANRHSWWDTTRFVLVVATTALAWVRGLYFARSSAPASAVTPRD